MKRILIIALALLALLALASCDGSVGTTGSSDNGDTTVDSSTQSTTDSTNNDTPAPDNGPEELEFKVYLKYNGQPFTQNNGTPVTVNWNDGISYYDSQVDENGVASIKGLDGDYNVSLKNLPSGYTYNPNVYVATNDSPEITVEILKLGTITGGTGVSEYKRKVLSQTSMYRAELKKDGDKIFFEFKAPKSGTYTIESWVSVADDKINPKIDVYTSNFAAPLYRYTIDGGGEEGRYTKNFKYVVEIADEMISANGQVVFIFAIYTTARNDKYYPATVDFAVQYEGGFELDHIQSDFVVPEALYSVMADKMRDVKNLTLDEFKTLCYERLVASLGGANAGGVPTLEEFLETDGEDCESEYNALKSVSESTLKNGLLLNEFLNANDKLRGIAEEYLGSYFDSYYDDVTGDMVWHPASTNIGGKNVLIADGYSYNEKTGFYHKYSEELYGSDPYGYGAGYGPILYADITVPTRTGVLDEAFTTVEYRGNKNLTVSNGRENFKFFIESYWGAQNMSQQVLGGGVECDDIFIGLLGYCSIVNGDGAAPVTRELMEFLQKYSVNQLLFMDGDGWAENAGEGHTSYESTENDQWLFACGYYE